MSDIILWAAIGLLIIVCGFGVIKLVGFCGMCGKLSTKKELVDGKCNKCH